MHNVYETYGQFMQSKCLSIKSNVLLGVQIQGGSKKQETPGRQAL